MVSISSSIHADPTNAIIRKQVQSIQFGYYTDDDVRERSVVEVTSALAFDPVTQTPLPNGLYDMKMGPIPGHSSTSSSLAASSCITCGRLVKDCIGHCGHIELCVPIYHPMLITNLLTLCQCICRNCFRFRMSRRQLNIMQMKFHLLVTEQYDKYYQLDTILAAAIYQARNQSDTETEGLPNKLAATRAAAVAVDQVLRTMKIEQDRRHTVSSTKTPPSPKSTYLEKLYNELCTETIKQLQSNTLRCSHCGAYSPKLRLDTSNKIFQCAMSKKYAQCNRSEGIVSFPSAIQYTLKKKNKGFYDDSNMYDSEDTERGTYDDEMGDDEDDDANEEGTDSTVSATSKKQRDMYLPPSELQAMVKHIYAIEANVCNYLFGTRDKYFMQCVTVLPNRFRPPMKVNTMMVEHVQTVALVKVLQTNSLIRDQMATILQQSQGDDTNTAMTALAANGNTSSTIYQSWIELQTAVNVYMDSSKDPSVSGSANTSSSGIRQILERKEGLFRKHMMGKRVNYACRSVISPDPYIGSNEIGLPKYFCTVLTYPTPVTQFNVSELRVAVERGPNQYPGARWVLIPASNGVAERVVDLSKMNQYQRRAISAQLLHVNKSNPKPYVVGRQLRDGDYVLMNRQPTLHKPGIMAHRVRVLHNPSQKTIRMHYANCNTYNADFDGDEMNCHFPQNDLARVEAKYLAQTDLQYIVPTDGSPLRGLIQDHVVGGVKMTNKDTFFKKWEFQQLLFAALSSLPGLEVIRPGDKFEMIPPAILKPCELWTGKQVITAVLMHLRKGSDRDSGKLSNLPGLSMERKSKTPDTSFGVAQQEHLVLIRDGELLRGVLDKNAFGATSFSVIHGVFEAYGPEKAGLLLNIFGRLFTAFLQYYSGHSCRMEDLILTKEADSERRSLIQRAYNLGALAAKSWADSEGGKVLMAPIGDEASALSPLHPVEVASTSTKIGLLLAGAEGKENFAALDGFMQGQLNPLASSIVKKTLPIGLAVPFPRNTFGIMTTTGAKGSIVNQSQVSCALGQQALEGRRVPRMSSGRTLPSFAPYDPNPRADGFVMDRFLTGIRPQEYYFHCMAGREGLVDTAVKTSRSGYLQRCLIKHLEELKIAYDFSVRNAEGNVIQFLYGEDGLDPTKASYLDCSAASFEFMARNHESLTRHNIALPSSTIDLAAMDASRYSDLSSCSPEEFKKDDVVLARRLLHGHARVRGAICRGWSFATVTKVHSKGKTVDIKYHSDGHVAKRVPIEAELGCAGGKKTMALTSKAVLVKPCALDPMLSSSRKHHLVGSSGACVSESVAESAAKAMSKNSELSQVMDDLKLQKQHLSTLICAKYSSSVCSPGEAVGSIAAQSVGEPSTQMTLNTFHLAGAGANVTLGIPRLREIIMTASRSLKTPTMSVPLLNSVSRKESIRLALGFKKLSLMDLLAGHGGISVTERLGKNESGGWLRSYFITLKFHPAERIKEAFGLSLQDIAQVVAKNFVPLLSQIMKKELKRSAVDDDEKMGEVVGGTSSEYLEDGFDNATQTPQGTNEQDDLNEADDEIGDDDVGEEDGVEFGRHETSSYDSDGIADATDEDDENMDVSLHSQPLLSDLSYLPDAKIVDREAPTILKRSNSIALQGLKVDPSTRPLLMVGLVEKAASAILVRCRKNIEEAFINEEPERGRCLQTSGINFEEIWRLDSVKHDELISNDIWAVRCHYGVEAARGSIMGQIRSVFGAYGIEVDPRHLSLIADYMTYDGGFKPMSRIGMEDSCSTLLQMSFETTAHFLKRASMSNAIDNIESPSANIVLGLPIKHGTGCFSLLARS